jgi:tRNA(fMet)-specific endonuclease VapC
VVVLSSVIIDTDIFSFIFRGDTRALLFESYLKGSLIYISFASIGELYFGACNGKWVDIRIKRLETHIARYITIPSNGTICKLYGDIRFECKNQPIDDADYWIAACARYYDIPLLTNNRKHFENIQGLKLVNPKPTN